MKGAPTRVTDPHVFPRWRAGTLSMQRDRLTGVTKVLEYDFEESVGWWVIDTANAFEREMAAALRPHGITFRQCQVLASLAMLGAASQAELAAQVGIEAPTLTGVLNRMERDGWIARRASETDRRKKLVEPLAKAQPAWERLVETAHSIRARALHGVSEEERAVLHRVLARIRDNLQNRPDDEVTT